MQSRTLLKCVCQPPSQVVTKPTLVQNYLQKEMFDFSYLLVTITQMTHVLLNVTHYFLQVLSWWNLSKIIHFMWYCNCIGDCKFLKLLHLKQHWLIVLILQRATLYLTARGKKVLVEWVTIGPFCLVTIISTWYIKYYYKHFKYFIFVLIIPVSIKNSDKILITSL